MTYRTWVHTAGLQRRAEKPRRQRKTARQAGRQERRKAGRQAGRRGRRQAGTRKKAGRHEKEGRQAGMHAGRK